MKKTNTILSRTGFSVAFMAALSLTIMITSMCLIQQGDLSNFAKCYYNLER